MARHCRTQSPLSSIAGNLWSGAPRAPPAFGAGGRRGGRQSESDGAVPSPANKRRSGSRTHALRGAVKIFTVFHEAFDRLWISEEPRRLSAWRRWPHRTGSDAGPHRERMRLLGRPRPGRRPGAPCPEHGAAGRDLCPAGRPRGCRRPRHNRLSPARRTLEPPGSPGCLATAGCDPGARPASCWRASPPPGGWWAPGCPGAGSVSRAAPGLFHRWPGARWGGWPGAGARGRPALPRPQPPRPPRPAPLRRRGAASAR